MRIILCQSFELQKTDLTDRYLHEFVEEENLPALQHLLTSLKETGKAKGELPVTLQSGQHKLFELTITSNVMSGFICPSCGILQKKADGREAVKK